MLKKDVAYLQEVLFYILLSKKILNHLLNNFCNDAVEYFNSSILLFLYLFLQPRSGVRY